MFTINSKIFTSHNMDTLAGHMKNKYINSGSPILKSLDPNINIDTMENASGDSPVNNGVLHELSSLNLCDDVDNQGCKSILLLDDRERLRVSSVDSFLKSLNIKPNSKIKVVSIFGNTGEGKSYTLNNVFFDGEQVFRTSSSQSSCTLGVWAMYHPKLNVICLDTEGLLGISKKEHQRTRLLLKVLAVSDIIIYRTRAERLQSSMYTFLGGASKAYKEHFSSALKKAFAKIESETMCSGLGPGVVIFHETEHTDTLHGSASVTESVEDLLHTNFAELNLSCDAFSFIKYIGIKTNNSQTSFKELKVVLLEKLENTEVRSPRDPKYVYLTLKSLNEKFQNQITDSPPPLYLPAYFTCPEKCQSCKNGCTLSMGHKDEGEPHYSTKACKFQHQYQNCVYLCRVCYKNGNKVIVKPSYQTTTNSTWSSYLSFVWSGYVIECPNCGEIYRSRQHWYGNKGPEDGAVRVEIVHIWPGDKHYFQEKALFGTQHSAQKVLDSVTMVSDVIAGIGAQPTQVITDWAADQIAPSYWRPNHEIKECYKCKTTFPPAVKKHHCRACGEGFCSECSQRKQPVPSKGWHTDVRVCDDCYREEPPSLSTAVEGTENRARQIGESVVNSISVVKCVFDYSKELIKESARPSYWVPDSECIHCAVCQKPFGVLRLLHHCRDCGKGVCEDCSNSKKPVPSRGWEFAVRVCDNCR